MSHQSTASAPESTVQCTVSRQGPLAPILAHPAGRGLRAARSAANTIGERDVVPGDFARAIRPMAGFRNLLIHACTRVDAARVHQAPQTHLNDSETFAQHIQRYLDRQPG